MASAARAEDRVPAKWRGHCNERLARRRFQRTVAGGRRSSHSLFDVHARDLYEQELERLFYRGHWCYVGLEAEIPNAGDFKRTSIGERSVIMVRDRDGGINVVENVCAHRGARSAARTSATAASSRARITSGRTTSTAGCSACR